MNHKVKRALPAVALLALALPAAAAAHANLVRTDPASGAVLSRAPSVVRVVFDDDVRVGPGIEAVRNGGDSVLGGAPQASGKTLTIPLRAHLRDGDYSVRWSIISDDGHLESGVLAFAVGAGRAPPTETLRAESTGPGAGTTWARWLFLAGVLAAVGIALYGLFVVRRRDRRVNVTLTIAAAAVAVGSGFEAYRVGLDTRYGFAMALGAGYAVLVASRALFMPRWPLGSLLYEALPLAIVPAVSGHARDPGIPGASVVFDVAHVLGASAWIGVLLGVLLVPGNRRRTGQLAGAGIALLGVTGALRAGFELTAFSQLWTTSYGRALLVKTGLLLVALGIGWLLRLDWRRRAAVEVAFAVAIVIAVAILVQLRPGRNYLPAAADAVALQPGPNPPAPPRDAVVLAQEAGRLAVALEAEPEKTTAIVLSPAGGGMSGLSVRFLPSGAVGSPCGSGCYSAAVPARGRVRVSIDGFGPPVVATFDVPARTPSAAATVRRLQQEYRALSGVTYVEHLASSPTDAIVARWRLERPNRLSYAVEGEGGGIVIGTRRWNQDAPGGRWVSSSQIPALPQPNTLWERATNAHLLSVGGRWETVSFADPGLGAFFTATIDRRTLRPRVLHMVAAAHFMTDRYTGFNAAREIRPPR